MATIYLQKVRGREQSGLIGYTADDMEALDRLRDGKRLRAKIVEDRSPPHHQLMFYCFRRLSEVLNDGPGEKVWDEDLVRRELLIRLGMAERQEADASMKAAYGVPVGLPFFYLVPASMAFERMDQGEAYRFFNRAVDWVIAHFGHWVEGHPSWDRFLQAVGQMAVPQETHQEEGVTT